MFKCLIHNHEYTDYEFVETKTFLPIDLPIKPMDVKLFLNDVFDYDSNQVIVKHSNTRYNTMIPGILDLTMTHGKINNKFLYLCKPDDKRIPFFLIPYRIPPKFDKSIQKLYITFKFDNWNNKRPHGIITQNIGNIHDLQSFYEYVLYCKSLNVSIQQFTKEAKKRIQDKSNEEIIHHISEKYNIEYRSKKDYYIFTLDPKNSNDFDDALSYDKKDNKISIYITNVALILNELELWDSFSNRISTIYLPDRKRTMLPTMLVDCLCSLKEKENKLCYVLDLYYDENNKLIREELGLCKAYIRKNIDYNDATFTKDNSHFQSICNILHIQNPKQIVSRLMLHFNHSIAKKLYKQKNGVFKTLYQETNEEIPKNLPEDVYKHICILKTNASNYCVYKENMKYKSFIHGDIEMYAQASSPIRRLVDLLNNIVILDIIGVTTLHDNGRDFYCKWTNEEHMEKINVSSRAIRKIQSKCQIYEQYMKHKDDKVCYEGYLFDKVYKDGDGKYQYMVYIHELRLTTYITLTKDLDEYSSHMFSLYVFLSEENEKKKIKLQLHYDDF